MPNNLKPTHDEDVIIERKAVFKIGIDLPKQKKTKVERERKEAKSNHSWTFT